MRIAVVEDDADYREFTSTLLREAGHAVHNFPDATAFMRQFRHDTFDLILIDWVMPRVSGYDLLVWLRRDSSHVPVIMITTRSAADDIVAGLEAGADDYIAKPVDAAVLLARVSALGRRFYPANAQCTTRFFGDFEFNIPTETLRIGCQDVVLTSKEFNLALTLFSNLSRPLSRNYLIEAVWGRNPDLPTRTLDTHVTRLRSKLGLRPERGYRLMPVYAYGYRLELVPHQEPRKNPNL